MPFLGLKYNDSYIYFFAKIRICQRLANIFFEKSWRKIWRIGKRCIPLWCTITLIHSNSQNNEYEYDKSEREQGRKSGGGGWLPKRVAEVCSTGAEVSARCADRVSNRHRRGGYCCRCGGIAVVTWRVGYRTWSLRECSFGLYINLKLTIC
jgi:hypothetical protein